MLPDRLTPRLSPAAPLSRRSSGVPAALLLCALGLWTLWGSPIEAASFDPSLEWRTIETEHFRITYHDDEARLAAEMREVCELVWSRVSRDFDSLPSRKVELVLVDPTDDANGMAMRLPVNTILLYVTGPQEDSSLNFYRNWNEGILTHELTHILHLDTIDGLPRVARVLFGQIVSVNSVSPGWIVEGMATWEETRRTEAGRGRSAEVEMIKRMTVLEGHIPPLGNMDGFQADPPSGNIRYLFGQDFVDYLARNVGEEKWREWAEAYGRRIPFFLPARKVFGRSFRELHKEWSEELTLRYEAQKYKLMAEGLTRSVLVSDGQAACSNPSFSPDGNQLAWFCSDRGRGALVRVADLDRANADFGVPNVGDSRVVVRDRVAKNLAWKADSSGFIFAAPRPVDPWYDLSDLYEVSLDSGLRPYRQLTRGARLRDPVFTPDGQGLLAIVNGAQSNNLVIRDQEGGLRYLTHFEDSTQLSNPAWSPDGRWIALSAWRPSPSTQGSPPAPYLLGMRDLWVFKADGTPWRRVTHDLAIERDPLWTPDGNRLIFVSDRSGVSNIYALDLETEHLWRLTNVLGGAFTPALSPDGALLAWAEYTWNGEDIRVAPLDQLEWRDMGFLPLDPNDGPPLPGLFVAEPARLAESASPETLKAPSDVSAQASASFDLSDSKPYNPLTTLFPPSYLMPWGNVSGGIVQGALSTSGFDILRQYGYQAWVTWRSDNGFVGGGASLSINRFRPTFELGAQRYSVVYNDLYELLEPPSQGGPYLPSVARSRYAYTDRRARYSATGQLPIGPYQAAQLSWTGESRVNHDPIPRGIYSQSLPTRGFLSSIGAGWVHRRTESAAYSVSPDRGHELALAAEWFTPWLGSHVLDTQEQPVAFEQLQLTAEARGYRDLPWVPNHVLALRAAGGSSLGDMLAEGSYRLGGWGSGVGLGFMPAESRPLRGFPGNVTWGDSFYLASAEYRLPIWRIDRGYGTFPLFFSVVHGLAFLDAGRAFYRGPAADTEPLVGAGAELHLDLVVGWGLGLDLLAGYGFALAGEGYAMGNPEGLYFGLGSGF